MLPRTIDKIRAMLPGGNIGDYQIPGTTARMLDLLGVKLEDLQAAVAAARSDDDVAVWLRAHGDATKYAIFNDRLMKRTTADLEDPARFARLYPWAASSGLTKIVEIMEEDDRRSFPA
jgi:hypothetical protein